MLKCPWWSVTKNKTIELDCYKDKSFGINLSIRGANMDHRGFDLRLSFWWTIAILFYDNRHVR